MSSRKADDEFIVKYNLRKTMSSTQLKQENEYSVRIFLAKNKCYSSTNSLVDKRLDLSEFYCESLSSKKFIHT